MTGQLQLFSPQAIEGHELLFQGDLAPVLVESYVLGNPEFSAADVLALKCSCKVFEKLIPDMIPERKLHEKIVTWMTCAVYQKRYTRLYIQFPHQPNVCIAMTIVQRDEDELEEETVVSSKRVQCAYAHAKGSFQCDIDVFLLGTTLVVSWYGVGMNNLKNYCERVAREIKSYRKELTSKCASVMALLGVCGVFGAPIFGPVVAGLAGCSIVSTEGIKNNALAITSYPPGADEAFPKLCLV